GLGLTAAARQPKPQLVHSQKTGTDIMPVGGAVDYNRLDQVPAVIRRNRASTVEALQQSGVDKYDIPAFLRKQADWGSSVYRRHGPLPCRVPMTCFLCHD